MSRPLLYVALALLFQHGAAFKFMQNWKMPSVGSIMDNRAATNKFGSKSAALLCCRPCMFPLHTP